ncbi:hypothetical protein SPACI_047470 [Sporomusa acidovorans DSM 3132]|uniref:Uncharacterized protein n=1 Tax=Sporomusa acidovorans (strain ATCC 49682 / DSM 3132 / Mol) TaxID=1123286 RepID=A0ABZ3J9P8_SPOA4|nr:hypothetical protein SPACI_43930 [Sporomusa acidovorans DSM 3132]SDD89250.1 hypothetical protein SAMN04488499_1005104 [Sporomusa acidovorans]
MDKKPKPKPVPTHTALVHPPTTSPPKKGLTGFILK